MAHIADPMQMDAEGEEEEEEKLVREMSTVDNREAATATGTEVHPSGRP